MTLNLLKSGEVAKITSVTADYALKARINGLGLRIGQEVAVIRRACMGGPLQVRVGHTDILMRPEQADLINLAK
ncbi:MAG: ferrous iron transport protein A [Gammaproteobacteria bacterium]|nr:MAG: ferrous iron transport protein A [Gammaproteobacteria bacterium]